MQLEQLSHPEELPAFPTSADTTQSLDTADIIPDASEQLADQPGLLRRLGAAAMRQLDLIRQYGPVAYISAHLDNSVECTSQLAKDHPKVAAMAAGVAIGSVGAKFGYDTAHQAMASHTDISAITPTHTPAISTEISNVPSSPHASLVAAYTKSAHHPDVLRATSPFVSRDYSNLPHGYDYDIAAMRSDATRAQAAGDLRIIYPDGYLPNGKPVNPNHFWYAVKETITRGGKHEEIWTTNIKQVLPTLAAHSDGARAFGSPSQYHIPRHVPHKYRPPVLAPEPHQPAPKAENGNDFWRHGKVIALAGVSVATALAANVFVSRRLRRAAPAQAAPIERSVRVVPESASNVLIRSMYSHGIIEVTGRHGAPVTPDEQNPSVIRPRIGTADFSTMASTTISAHTSPDQPGVMTLRLGMADGSKIGAPLVESARSSTLSNGQPAGNHEGYVALSCNLNLLDQTQPVNLLGVTENGQTEELPLAEGPTRYYVNLLADILAKDIENATSAKKKVREQALQKVTLILAS